MAKRVNVAVSAARAKLFELTDLVRRGADDTVVVLEHRGTQDQVVLVREARLAYLETRVKELEKLVTTPFKLAGSLTTRLDDEALDRALAQIRAEWTPRHPDAAALGTQPRSPRKPARRRA